MFAVYDITVALDRFHSEHLIVTPRESQYLPRRRIIPHKKVTFQHILNHLNRSIKHQNRGVTSVTLACACPVHHKQTAGGCVRGEHSTQKLLLGLERESRRRGGGAHLVAQCFEGVNGGGRQTRVCDFCQLGVGQVHHCLCLRKLYLQRVRDAIHLSCVSLTHGSWNVDVNSTVLDFAIRLD